MEKSGRRGWIGLRHDCLDHLPVAELFALAASWASETTAGDDSGGRKDGGGSE